MPAHTMIFLKRTVSPFVYSILPKCSFFSTLKLSGVKSPDGPQAEAKGDRKNQRKIDMTHFLLNECGLSESQVLAIDQKYERLFKTKSICRAHQAVQFLRDSGFTKGQVRKIVHIQPITLVLKVDTQLKPKIEFMKALGFTDNNLGRFISREPRLLTASLENNLSPKISLLVGVFGLKVNLCKTLARFPRFLLCKFDDLKPRIDLLKQSKMQDEILLYVLRSRPLLILGSEEGLKLKIEYVKNLGVLEGSKAFAKALSVVHCYRLENFENKLKLLATLGLLENEILHIVRKFPTSFGNGIEKITKTMDFLKNTAGFQPNILVSYPAFFSYSIENRFQPRHKVIEFLRKTDTTRLPKNLASVYNLSGQRFADKFLKGSPEAAKLFEK